MVMFMLSSGLLGKFGILKFRRPNFNHNFFHHFISAGSNVGTMRVGWKEKKEYRRRSSLQLAIGNVISNVFIFVVWFDHLRVCYRNHADLFFAINYILKIYILAMGLPCCLVHIL